MVKVVTLTTHIHVANIANEWLPCTKQNWSYLCNESEIKFPQGQMSVLRADIKVKPESFPRLPDIISFFFLLRV